MSFLIFNAPGDLPWYTNVFDLALTTTFAVGVVSSARAYRRRRPDYAFVMLAAFWYGLILELSGMAWKDSYQQGRFAVMLNWGVFPLWAHATYMPSYVLLFYPTFFFLGYRLLEGLAVTSLWKRAVTGGAIIGLLLDPAYIIQGNLDQSRWWTWKPWILYQFWLGWPLADLWWQTTWGALFCYVVYRLRPRIDERFAGRRLVFFLGAPLAIGVGMNIFGPLLHVPFMIVTYAGWRQWPLVVVMVAAAAWIALSAERRPVRRLDPVLLIGLAVYIAALAAMQVGNVIDEDGLRFHTAVQSAALIGLTAVALAPLLAGRAPTTAPSGQERSVVGRG